jgi:hypothetical protein
MVKFWLLPPFLGLAMWGMVASAQPNLKSPDVSANTLFLYRNSNFAGEDTSEVRNGVDLREAEVAFVSDVDPYSRLTFLLSVHPVYTVDNTASSPRVKQTWAVEPEELFAESSHFPLTTVKVGKFKGSFGKHNLLHTHAFPFVDAPLANEKLLGSEGLSDVGLSAAVLVPLPWFFEITAQYFRGEGENDEFNSPTPGDGVGLLHIKNLWDLTESLTLEFGLSKAKGNNSFAGKTSLGGMDLTLKWRPLVGGKYKSAMLGLESIHRSMTKPDSQREKDRGYTIWGQFQFAERWAALVRHEKLTVNDSLDTTKLPNLHSRRETLGLVFNATEFSSFRLEYSEAVGPTNAKDENKEKKIYLQTNFTIGAHPAHSY